MKVTLNWLKQYVDFTWSPEELSERLTMIGIEVEGVEKTGGEFEGIVVAQILTRDKVPGSDKLSVCKVNDGQGERTIICGACKCMRSKSVKSCGFGRMKCKPWRPRRYYTTSASWPSPNTSFPSPAG